MSAAATLLTTNAVQAEIGFILRYDIIDRASDSVIGHARRGTIWDLDRRPVVQLQRSTTLRTRHRHPSPTPNRGRVHRTRPLI
jgi:hypothetical protein